MADGEGMGRRTHSSGSGFWDKSVIRGKIMAFIMESLLQLSSGVSIMLPYFIKFVHEIQGKF